MPRLRPLHWAIGYAAFACIPALVLLGSRLSSGPAHPLTPAQERAKRADVGGPFPLELRSPQVVAGTAQRVLVALGRPSLGELMAKSRQSPVRQRAYVRSLYREERALISALHAKGVNFGRPVLYARVWSGFAATIATKDLPAVQTLGLRVESVSRFYPAQVTAKDAPLVRPLPTKTKSQRVAVLDAFPRRGERLLADEVGAVGTRKRSAAERAGSRLAAVVSGELPTADVAGIRAAGLQALETGRFEVFGTTDQLIAALERAVDPDRNGDSSDAVQVALTGLSAPYSGFAHSPAADAVDAAAQLGTLVVAAAGNGGQSTGPYGTIGDPGGAAGALTVGALDGSGEPAPASSRGPTYDLTPKPDLAIGGGAKTKAGTAWGTAIAAARVAGVAGALRSERPKLTVAQAAAALVGTAAPRGPLFEAGGGDPLLQAARVLRKVPASAAAVLAARLRAPLPLAPPPPIGPLRVVTRNRKPDGVRFVAGSIKRNPKGQSVIPVGRLVLTLEGPGRRELTPPGGARDLLPGEYAYTLTPEILGALPAGRYRFVLRVSGKPGVAGVTRRSRPFRIG